MRIINRFNIGGPTYNATFLTRYLSSDFETLLVGGLPEKDESDSLYILDNYGVKPHLIEEMKRKPSLISDVKAFLRIRSMMKKFRPHIVHTHASKAGVLGRLAAISLGVPVVVHTFHGHVFHSYFSGWKTFIFKTIERLLAKGSTAIIALSQLQKKELVQEHRIAKEQKFVPISLGFDLSRFRENKDENRRQIRQLYSLDDDTLAIAIVGRLAPIKNHRLFLDMSRLVAARTAKKCVFFIVGDGSESEWIKDETEVLNANGSGRWVMTSWVKDVAAFNSGMDIICLTSNNEGTPVSLIEAQAAGLPIVSTDVGGVKDIVKDQVTGVIVPPNDTELFADALLELIENEKKRHFLSQNGWTHVEQSFHYTTLVNNMEQLYRKLIHEKGIKHVSA